MWDLINSSAVIKSRCVRVQRFFMVINESFAHAGGVLFKSIEGLFVLSDLTLKNILLGPE